MFRKPLTLAVVLATTLFFGSSTWAHFVWIYEEGGDVKIVFGESLEPDQAQFLQGLNGMQVYRTVDGKPTPLKVEKLTDDDLGWFQTSLKEAGPAVDLHCAYGVFGRGDKTMLLDYNAKFLQLDKHQPRQPNPNLQLDLVPRMENGKLQIQAFMAGKPVSGVEIQVTRMNGPELVVNTDEQGQAQIEPSTRYLIRAKHSVPESGEVDGQAYSEKRFYCTLVIDRGTQVAEPAAPEVAAQTGSNIRLTRVENNHQDFPKGMTSFGATVVDGRIFVIGGKSGRAHSYARSYQNRDVLALDVAGKNPTWKSVGENLGLQGLAIVGHAGRVIRLGGLEARNQEGEDHDLHSIADVKIFDPTDQSWHDLPSLPQGRSSLDACVFNDKIYVAGGWSMQGEQDSVWADDLLVFDLAQTDGKWQSIPAPFRTRALALRSHAGKLYAMGGIKESGGPTAEVHVFDPQSGKWSVGPELPIEGRMKAFGCSAVDVAGHLLVSTYDGGIYDLDDQHQKWSRIHELANGRFFHQMLPMSDNTFALVGGSHMEYGSQLEIEVYRVEAEEDTSVTDDQTAKTVDHE